MTTGSLLMFGSADGDRLTGGANGDTLYAAAGDHLFGGAGTAIFQYRAPSDSTLDARDLILDFLSGTDRIDLARIDADTATAGDQAFTFIGENASGNSAGQPRAYATVNGTWFVDGDVDGDGVADLRIEIISSGNLALASSDVIL